MARLLELTDPRLSCEFLASRAALFFVEVCGGGFLAHMYAYNVFFETNQSSVSFMNV
jgi:hypothetical protein